MTQTTGAREQHSLLREGLGRTRRGKYPRPPPLDQARGLWPLVTEESDFQLHVICMNFSGHRGQGQWSWTVNRGASREWEAGDEASISTSHPWEALFTYYFCNTAVFVVVFGHMPLLFALLSSTLQTPRLEGHYLEKT